MDGYMYCTGCSIWGLLYCQLKRTCLQSWPVSRSSMTNSWSNTKNIEAIQGCKGWLCIQNLMLLSSICIVVFAAAAVIKLFHVYYSKPLPFPCEHRTTLFQLNEASVLLTLYYQLIWCYRLKSCIIYLLLPAYTKLCKSQLAFVSLEHWFSTLSDVQHTLSIHWSSAHYIFLVLKKFHCSS